MIVRIMGEQQFEVGDATVAKLTELDKTMLAAIESGDEERFTDLLEKMIELVRSAGTPVAATEIVPSDLIVPHEGATLHEIRSLLASEESGEA